MESETKEKDGRGSRRHEQEAKETVEIHQSGKNLSEEGGKTTTERIRRK